MAGKHQFTSSNWVQSGSIAQFKSGVTTTTITADTFVGDGSGLSGIGTEVFFAGSGSGISGSPATSIDHVIVLGSGQDTALPGSVLIQTTHSADFNPNYYSFIKIQDTFVTRQAGGNSSYTGFDDYPGNDSTGQNPYENDLAPGVHRYLVYATETGSANNTQLVYSTVFIKGFINVPPTIAHRASLTMSLVHDTNTKDIIFHFTGSEDSNANDFIRVYSASRVQLDPPITSVSASYDLFLKHPQTDITDSQIFIATGSISLGAPDGYGPYASAMPDNALVFTASISNYSVMDGTTIHAPSVQPYQETFTVYMQDNNQFENASSVDVNLLVIPPSTASISNIRAHIESGSFSGIGIDNFTTTVLYDDVITRDNIVGLHPRYTASLVRVSVMADITEPPDYVADGTHFTEIKFLESGGTPVLNNKTFRFSGSMATGLFRATASAYGNNFTFANVTESLGFSPFQYTPATYYLINKTGDTTDIIRHGTYNHISDAAAGPMTTLTVTPVPDIEISNVRVEVESGSFLTGVGAFERSASVLYGYTSSLQVSETSSLEEYEKSAEYISESVVRLRLLATVTEPFGPHHTNMKSTLETTPGSDYVHSYEFQFHTGSGATYTASSEIAYDEHNRLVGHYTSSWINFNLLPGKYTFSASFDSATNAGRTIIPGTYASVSVSATPPTEITNIVYESETYGYSDIGSADTMRTVLYGTPHHTLINSASFEGHDSASLYASHSVSRFRVLATVTEPFGPHHTASRFEKVWSSGGQSTIIDTFTADETSNSGNGIVFNGSANDDPDSTGWSPIPLWNTSLAGQFNDYNSNGYFQEPQASNVIYNHGSTILIGQAKIDGESTTYPTNGVTIFGSNTNNGSDWETLATTTDTISDTEKTLQWIPQESYQWYRFDFNPTNTYFPINYIKLYTGTTSGTLTGFTDISSSILFSTGSVHTASSAIAYDVQNRLVAHYTSSWVGQQLSASSNSFTEWTYTSGSILHTPNDASGFVTESGQSTTMVVHDTPKVAIEDVFWETETHGYSDVAVSNAARTVLYGDPRITNATSESLSWTNHPSASIYASQSVSRIRFRAKVTEPIGPGVHKIQVSASYGSGSKLYMIDTGSIAEGGLVTYGYDDQDRLVTRYTQSFTGRSFTAAAGGNTVYALTGSFMEQASGENGFDITETNGELTVHDTPPTIIKNIFVESENYGHSASAATDIGVTGTQQRTVLYGVTRRSLADSSSFATHDSASLYASQSVSRFRIRAEIIEPVGPVTYPTTVTKILKSPGQANITETITFETGSSIVTVNSFEDSSNRIVAQYTSSFSGSSLSVGAGSTRDWIIEASFVHTPSNENDHIISPPTTTTMKIIDTAPTIIENWRIETETRGESGIGTQNTSVSNASAISRSILYGEETTRATGSDLSDIYDPHAVTRFRILTEIIEPVGPMHSSSLMRYYIDNKGYGGNTKYSEFIAFSTSSTQTALSEVGYDEQSRLVGRYTSSWIGETLSGSYNNNSANDYIQIYLSDSTNFIKHDNVSENGYQSSTSTQNLYLVVSASKPLEIDGLRVETEAFPYSSSIGASSRTQKILYGFNNTLTAQAADTIGDIWSGSAAMRFRILGKVIEPLGLGHFQTQVSATDGQGHSFAFGFHTASQDTASDSGMRALNSDNLFSQTFTSSWYGAAFFAANSYTFTPSAETGSNTTGVYIVNDSADGIETGSVASADITIQAPDATQITNLRVEVEKEYSGSTAGTSSRETRVLHGLRTTETDNAVNHTYLNSDSRNQLVSMRVLADIKEPFGPHHAKTEVDVTGFSNIQGVIPDDFTGPEFTPLVSNITASHYHSSYPPGNILAGASDWLARWSNSAQTYNIATGLYETKTMQSYDDNTTLWIAINCDQPTVINRIVVEHRTNGYHSNSAISVSGSTYGGAFTTGSVANWEPLHFQGDTAQDKDMQFENSTPYRRYLISFAKNKWQYKASGNNEYAGAENIFFYRAPDRIGTFGEHKFILHTGSAHLSSSVASLYEQHGSQSMSYTSSFTPIQFINSGGLNTDPEVFIISASKVTHGFNDSKTVQYAAVSESVVTVFPAQTASITVAASTSSLDMDYSSSSDLPVYVTYNADNDILIDVVSGISASAPLITSESYVRFADHAHVNYDTNGNVGLTFAPAKSSNSSHNTSSLTIDSSYMSTLTKVEHLTVLISGSTTISDPYYGQGTSSVSEFAFAVVPAKPQTMEGKYWGSVGAGDHDTDNNSYGAAGISFAQIDGNNRRMYAATLPTGLTSYGPGHSAGSHVTNVIMAKESHTGPTDYAMSFTPFTPAATGNYGDNDRLFDFGDSGSLIVKINGSEIVNYNLGTEFEPSDKDGEQDIAANYTGGGTASFTAPHADLGRLIITTVQPFNNVSQSIQNGVEYYPNGYQGWSARIEIDSKLNDGYNNLEFSHSINDEIIQSWKPFSWYYDDGIKGEPTISLHGEPTLSYTPLAGAEPTFSLSGVSYFKEVTDFKVSLNDRVHAIPHNTYRRSDNASDYVSEIGHDHAAFLQLTTGSGLPAIVHRQSLYNLPANMNGLQFETSSRNTVPTSYKSASIKDFTVQAQDVTNADLGQVYQLYFQTYKRELNSADSWTIDPNIAKLPIGRFLDAVNIAATYNEVGGVSSRVSEDFRTEVYRWTSASFAGSASFNFNTNAGGDYGTTNTSAASNQPGSPGYEKFWLDGEFSQSIVNSGLYNDHIVGPSFQSHISISGSNELQQYYDGRLKYPTLDYTSVATDQNGDTVNYAVMNPNAPDYSNEAGDKFYCRSFYFEGSSVTNKPYIFVFTDDNNLDNFRITNTNANAGVGIDDRDVRIDLALPGPQKSSGTTGGYDFPGTKFQNLFKQKGKQTLSVTDDGGLYTQFSSYNTGLTGAYRVRADFGGFEPAFSGFVILMRIRIKAGYANRITGIHISENSSGDL